MQPRELLQRSRCVSPMYGTWLILEFACGESPLLPLRTARRPCARSTGVHPISRTDRPLRPSDGKPCLRRVANTPMMIPCRSPMGPVAEALRPYPGLSRGRVATTLPTIGQVVMMMSPALLHSVRRTCGANIVNAYAQRRHAASDLGALVKRGGSVTADHLFSQAPRREERSGGTYAMVNWDLGARWGHCFPSAEQMPLMRDYPYASSGQPPRRKCVRSTAPASSVKPSCGLGSCPRTSRPCVSQPSSLVARVGVVKMGLERLRSRRAALS